MNKRIGRLALGLCRHCGDFPRRRLQLVAGSLVVGFAVQGSWRPGYLDIDAPFFLTYLGLWVIEVGLLVPEDAE